VFDIEEAAKTLKYRSNPGGMVQAPHSSQSHVPASTKSHGKTKKEKTIWIKKCFIFNFRVKYNRDPSTRCHLGPSILKLHFEVHKFVICVS
jgi:hypothetical protein